jgi:hypothetical protein
MCRKIESKYLLIRRKRGLVVQWLKLKKLKDERDQFKNKPVSVTGQPTLIRNKCAPGILEEAKHVQSVKTVKIL